MIPETLKQLSIKVSQYFLDFLESDFKRQQAPRRRLILQTESGFKAGMSLAPYPTLQVAVWQQLGRTWDAAALTLSPRLFTRTLSQPLRHILREQTAALTEEPIATVTKAVVTQARNTLSNAVSHPEEWVLVIRQELSERIGTNIVRPMLSFLDAAVKTQAYSSVDSIFAAESDLISALAEPLDAALPEVLSRFAVSRDTAELEATASALLSLEFTKSCLAAFFEAFAASDAFLEFRDLETYVTTAEGLELYLYIGTIKYGSAIYPLFYLPIESLRDASSGIYTIKLKNQLYANKRAIDFILQELGERQQRQWLSPIAERIAYLTADRGIVDVLEPLLIQISRAYGFLDDIRLSAGPISQLTNTNVSLSNALYLCAFEKADEALLNDYEEMIAQIRNNTEGVVDLFQSIVDGVITSNPVSIAPAIEKEWDGIPIDQRAVPDMPIPLNEEQQKVLQAVRHPEGRFIVVEGPPGTGKSHTIVAIAADCAFRQKSCLILSDKPEALDVVHSKLSAAMNEVRGSDEFPNPLLRLGTEQANFRRLTSAHAMTQVEAHVKAANANRKHLQDDRDVRRDNLRRQIRAVIDTVGSLKTRDIAALEHISQEIDRLSGDALSAALEQVYEDSKTTPFVLSSADLTGVESFLATQFAERPVRSRIELAVRLQTYTFASEIHGQFSRDILDICPTLAAAHVDALSSVTRDVMNLRIPLFGWLFRRRKLRELAAVCQNLSTFSKEITFPGDLKIVSRVVDTGRNLKALTTKHGNPEITFDAVYEILAKASLPVGGLGDLTRFAKLLSKVSDHPALKSLVHAKDPADQARLWILAAQYVSQLHAIGGTFAKAPQLDYIARKTDVEHLNTALMNAEVDSRLVSFMETSRTDAKVLAKLIKDRQKFPEDKFESVKNAFPVMIASIREFGEYMPLKHGLIDVLVIDEASQVSVAQAFPALLRAKKVVVMGDSKQFSNTKSSNASIALNQKYRGELDAFFRREVSSQADMLERLSYFDVKRSVLEFCALCANYSIMLRKHFRSYKELINYSSVTFYGGQLQAIKLRTLPLSDCIEFAELDVGDEKFARNTNTKEADYIIDRCVELLAEEVPPTVGVITPFREQQSLLSRMFANHARSSDFRTRLKIKVMTFDSCQGEERNVIFYSMVATRSHDLLNYIFPVALGDAEELVAEKLKMQRLNVGFSRAQEMVWFVLSKPLSEFKGSIGEAMRHFQRVLVTPTASAAQTDPLSPMERKVLDWIYATQFYQTRVGSVEVTPQFPLGEYLRQLDPHYKHPAWRVDFLVSIEIAAGVVYVVIEYDGFEYHFKKGVDIDIGNHERFLNEADLERQLTLESYGYRFLRLNRFNLGRDPVSTLSERLERLLAAEAPTRSSGAVRSITEQATALVDGSARKCERCGTIKPLEAFFDKSLGSGKGGTGRICVPCKEQERLTKAGGGTAPRRRKWHRRWR